MDPFDRGRMMKQYKERLEKLGVSYYADDAVVDKAVTNIRALTTDQVLHPSVIGELMDVIKQIPADESNLQRAAVSAINTLSEAAHHGNRGNLRHELALPKDEQAPEPEVGQFVLAPRLEYCRDTQNKNCTSDRVIPTGEKLAYQDYYLSLVIEKGSQPGHIVVLMLQSSHGNGLEAIPDERLHEFVLVVPEGMAYQHLLPGHLKHVPVLFTRDRKYHKGSMMSLQRTEVPTNVYIKVVPGSFTEESMVRLLVLLKEKQEDERASIRGHLRYHRRITSDQELQLRALGQPRDNEEYWWSDRRGRWSARESGTAGRRGQSNVYDGRQSGMISAVNAMPIGPSSRNDDCGTTTSSNDDVSDVSTLGRTEVPAGRKEAIADADSNRAADEALMLDPYAPNDKADIANGSDGVSLESQCPSRLGGLKRKMRSSEGRDPETPQRKLAKKSDAGSTAGGGEIHNNVISHADIIPHQAPPQAVGPTTITRDPLDPFGSYREHDPEVPLSTVASVARKNVPDGLRSEYSRTTSQQDVQAPAPRRSAPLNAQRPSYKSLDEPREREMSKKGQVSLPRGY